MIVGEAGLVTLIGIVLGVVLLYGLLVVSEPLIANHLVSAIDAYVSGSTGRGRAPLSVWAEATPAGTRWSAFARFEVP